MCSLWDRYSYFKRLQVRERRFGGRSPWWPFSQSSVVTLRSVPSDFSSAIPRYLGEIHLCHSFLFSICTWASFEADACEHDVLSGCIWRTFRLHLFFYFRISACICCSPNYIFFKSSAPNNTPYAGKKNSTQYVVSIFLVRSVSTIFHRGKCAVSISRSTPHVYMCTSQKGKKLCIYKFHSHIYLL